MKLGRLRALVPGRRNRSARGAAELSVVVVAGSLVAGVLFGNGAARTAVDVADGLTWFTDDPTGEVIEVNPATGRPEARLPVGNDGDTLDIAQYDGRLIVTNRTTGQLTSFDLSSLLASGGQRVTPGGATDVLDHGDDVFLLDRERGTIAHIDPVTTDAIGEMWSSPTGLADAAVDGRGRIWAVDPEGLLTELRWSTSSLRFVAEEERQIDHSGARSVLVGHDEGVTLFGPEAGIVVQVGTGRELVADAIRMTGDLEVPDEAPDDLVPAASPDSGTVAIVGDGVVREVEVSAIGCEEPSRPEVFEGIVYVPCAGAGRVVRLTPDGQRAGADIEVADPDGDPDLVLDDGSLLVNVPGSAKGAVVHADGTVTTIVRYDDTLPTSGGSSTALAPLTAPTQPLTPVTDGSDDAPTVPVDPQPDPGGQPGPDTTGPRGVDPDDGPDTDEPDPSDPPTTPTVDPDAPLPLEAPRSVRATELPSGAVQVTWQHPGDPADSFTVQEDGGEPLVTVGGTARQASVTVPPGDHRFTVSAFRDGDPVEISAPSNEVSTSGRPGPVSNIVGHVAGNPDDTSALVTVSWQAPPEDSSKALTYQVVMTDATGSQTQTVATTEAAFTTYCETTYCNPTPVTIEVTAVNESGAGQKVRTTLTSYDGPEAPALPAAGADLVSRYDHSWQGRDRYGRGSTTISLSSPADWRNFQGTCTWTHSGNKDGDQTIEYPCNARSVRVTVYTGFIYGPDDGEREHSIVFTASNGTESVSSDTFEWETKQEVWGQG